MTVQPGRGRRRASAAAEAVVEPEPELTPSTPKPASRRRGAPRDAAPAAAQPQPLELVPAPPREEPAVLHPSDRRGPTRPFSRPLERPWHRVPSDQLAIGEIDQTLFDCPNCRRPLALGARRCPGCGTRLIRSIPLTKAAAFVLVGVLTGALVGVGGSLLLAASRTAGGPAAAVVAASDAPSAQPAGSPSSALPTLAPTPAASVGPVGDSIPPITRAALLQALDMSGRLGVAEADLRAELAAPSFDATAVAQELRTISADMVFAEQVAGRVASWSGSSELGGQLEAFYASVHETASTALLNSVRNTTAYRSAARTMATLLATRAALDDAVRATAEAAGVSLPEPSTAP